MKNSLLVRVVLFLTGLTAAKSSNDYATISLRNIKSLQLQAGQLTAGRNPVEQLSCTGGSAHGLYNISDMTCENIAGQDDYGIEELNWRCSAHLPEEFSLGSTDVSCEFASEKDDDRVLSGSCSVVYKLMLTELGEQRFPNHQPPSDAASVAKDKSWTDVIFWGFFTSIAAFIIFSIFRDARATTARDTRPQRRRGFNDGGFDDPDDHDLGNDGPEHPTDQSCESQDGTRTANWVPLALGGGVASAVMMNRYSQRRTQSPTGLTRTEPAGSSSLSQSSTPSYSFDTSRSSSGFGGTARR